MSYYWLKRQEIQQKAKGRYSIETAAEYYGQNKEAIKNLSTKNLSTREKNIKNWFSIKKKL